MQELELEPSDTLGRWMAHHIAELVAAAQGSSDSPSAAEQAAAAILRVWEHRATYRAINPFADLGPVLDALLVLGQEPPWGSLRRREARAASELFDRLRRLVLGLVLLGRIRLADVRAGLKRAGRTAAWQSEQERLISAYLSILVTSFGEGAKEAGPSTESASAEGTGEGFILGAVLHILDELDASTAALRKALREADSDGVDAVPMTQLAESSEIPDRVEVVGPPGQE